MAFIASTEVLIAQQRQTPGSSTPANAGSTAGISGNTIQIKFDEPALRDALVKLLGWQQNPPATTTLDLNVLNPDLQTALANWLKKETDKKEEVGIWTKLFSNGAAVAAILGSLLTGIVTGGLSFLGIRMTLQKQETRELKLLEERNKFDLERDAKAAEADLRRDQAAADAAYKEEIGIAKMSLDRERGLAKMGAVATRELEQLRANIAIAEAVRQVRFERLQKFHAPLRSLFQQSKGVTDKLYHHIYASRKTGRWGNKELAFMTEEEVQADEVPNDAELEMPGSARRRLYVKHDGQWRTFRMLDFMPLLLKDSSSKHLVDKIVEIGRRITALISDYGGLAAAGQEPSPVFGQYLAHFAILEAIYLNPPAEPNEPESQRVGYYPRELDKEVEEGYLAARNAVSQYETVTLALARPNAPDANVEPN